MALKHNLLSVHEKKTNPNPPGDGSDIMFLEVTTPGNVSLVLFFGTIGMLALTIGLIVFIIFHQRKVIRYQLRLQRMSRTSKSSCSMPPSGCRKKKGSGSRRIFTMMPVHPAGHRQAIPE